MREQGSALHEPACKASNGSIGLLACPLLPVVIRHAGDSSPRQSTSGSAARSARSRFLRPIARGRIRAQTRFSCRPAPLVPQKPIVLSLTAFPYY
jgi:hypothetical protein